MFGCIGTGGKLAVNSGFGKQAGVGNKGIDSLDAGIEIVLDIVEISVVTICNSWWNIASGNFVLQEPWVLERT